MGDKTFNLTWNNHLANLSGLFEGLYKSGSLTDTTLACQGGMIRAHKLVLAACSPYFERVFKEHHGEQPILILKGVPVEEMECLLDFMYRGSINVAEEHLPSLIKTATDLEIRGLSGDERSESENVYSRVEVEASVRACQIDSRLDDYTKMCNNAIAADCIKLEEIEVEDDPMVMESHEEDSFEESLQSSPSNKKQLIRHVPAPMFKRQIRYEKRVSLGRPITDRDKDNYSSEKQRENKKCSFREEENDSGSPSAINDDCGGTKFQHGNNGNLDPTIPAIQMNEDSLLERDSMEQLNSPDGESLDEPEANTNGSKKYMMEVKKDIDGVGGGGGGGGQRLFECNERKERIVLPKREKSQYKPFPCDLCTLAFTRASHLARHRRVHTGERPFACSLCPRMFARQDKLKQHLDSHMQWPKRKSLTNLAGSGVSGMVHLGPSVASAVAAAKGKRGRPRKVNTRTSITENTTGSRDD